MNSLPHEKQIQEYESTLSLLKKQSHLWSDKEIAKMEKKLEQLKQKIYSKLTPWERVTISRHPKRPHSYDFIENICEDFIEIHGDRSYADDQAVVMGFGKIQGEAVFIIGQEKGKDTDERIKRNFGMPHPEGYRKVLRGMKLAEKFQLPVVSLIDTPGAYPGLSAEERGQGWAIAKNLQEMAGLEVPIIVVIIGEGCSGGALGMGVGDEIAMLEHSYYSVISPEGCASILWKDASKNEEAAKMLQLHPEALLPLGIIDHIIAEPKGGAHLDPAKVFSDVKAYLHETLLKLSSLTVDTLVEQRYKKFRQLGAFIDNTRQYETSSQSSS
jgi:acetyl-CoA carboxylase carboxyl transferase subunit alpha